MKTSILFEEIHLVEVFPTNKILFNYSFIKEDKEQTYLTCLCKILYFKIYLKD